MNLLLALYQVVTGSALRWVNDNLRPQWRTHDRYERLRALKRPVTTSAILTGVTLMLTALLLGDARALTSVDPNSDAANKPLLGYFFLMLAIAVFFPVLWRAAYLGNALLVLGQ